VSPNGLARTAEVLDRLSDAPGLRQDAPKTSSKGTARTLDRKAAAPQRGRRSGVGSARALLAPATRNLHQEPGESDGRRPGTGGVLGRPRRALELLARVTTLLINRPRVSEEAQRITVARFSRPEASS
jgi:hypothetical protein